MPNTRSDIHIDTCIDTRINNSHAPIAIVAHGHYAEPVNASSHGSALPELKTLVKSVIGENVRRIGRFIQLALIGAGRCVNTQTLPSDTGIYLTSGRGDLEVTVEVLDQIIKDSQPPKPLSFINTVSNSACFYLAKHFHLQSRSLFVTRRYAPLESVFQLALLDLQTTAMPLALVGSVDICTEPLNEHRQRLAISADTIVGEGSHWFLLARATPSAPALATIDEVQLLPNANALTRWLVQHAAILHNAVLVCGQHVDAATAQFLRDSCAGKPWPVTQSLHWYDSHCGFALGQFLQVRPAQRMLHIDSDPDGRFNLLLVSLVS
jgi:hypothetical protein